MKQKLKSLINKEIIVYTPYSHALDGTIKSFDNNILELYQDINKSSTYVPFDKIIAVTVH